MIWLLNFLIPLASFAYIPEYGAIAARVADQHGRGIYQIDQEVTYSRESETYTVHETWIVTDEGRLQVRIEGRGPLRGLAQGSIIFDGSIKSFTDSSGVAKTQRLGDEWIEPLFQCRSSKYFRSRLVNLKVTPAESLNDRAPLAAEGAPNYQAPGFIRLSRTGGSVAWAIGAPAGLGTSPTIWIEQDQFVIRKFRSSSGSIIRADDYQKFAGGLWYPKSQVYQFGPNTVQIKTTSVKSIGKLPANSARDQLKLPEVDGLREFYSRFR